MIEFRVFSALLSYPSAEMHGALGELADIIGKSPLVAERERNDLMGLIDALGEGDLLDAEERYSELFDR